MSNNLTPTVIGIDIGSLTAKVAAVINGAVTILTNEANFRETPVIVGFGDSERKIGQMGQIKLKSNYLNSVVSPFRLAEIQQGSPEFEKIMCKTQWQKDKFFFKVLVQGVETLLTVQQVMAGFITQIKKMISFHKLQPILTVLTVPSYFTQRERKCLLNAAFISGMEKVKLVTETVAAGLNYGSFKRSQFQQGKNVLFVDFGYQKLNLSLLTFTCDKMEVIAEKSIQNLGCKDIDDKIFEMLCSKFQEKTGLNILNNPKGCLKLREIIEKQRKILTGICETDVSIECLMEDQDLNQPFTRNILHEAAAQVFNKITDVVYEFQQNLEKNKIKIDSVQLLGGGSRIYKFVQIIKKAFKITPSRTMNSSEAVAEGATLAAVQQSNMFRMPRFEIINRSTHQISFDFKKQGRTEMQNQVAQAQESISVMEIGQNLPITKKIKLSPPKKIQILYKGIQNKVNPLIASIELEIQHQKQINIEFEFNLLNQISIKYIKDNEGSPINFKFTQINEISTKELQKMKNQEHEMRVRDQIFVEVYEANNELESYIYKQKNYFNCSEKSRYTSDQEKSDFSKLIQDILSEIDLEREKSVLNVQSIRNKREIIQKFIQKLNVTHKKRKFETDLQIKKLGQVQQNAVEILKQVMQKFRKSKNVQEVCNKISQIQLWAEQNIKIIRSTQSYVLFATPQHVFDQQHLKLKHLYDSLTNSRFSSPIQESPYVTRSSRVPQASFLPQRDYNPFRSSRSDFINNSFSGFF